MPPQGDRVPLFDLADVQGLFEEVLGFLGSGCELMLALTSKQALATVSQSTQATATTVTYSNINTNIPFESDTSVSAASTLSVASLHLSTALPLPCRSVWYYLSTQHLCEYGREHLGLLERSRRTVTPTATANSASVSASNKSNKCLMDGAAARGLVAGVLLLRHHRGRGGDQGGVNWDWDEGTCYKAAGRGQLAVLKVAFVCPYSQTPHTHILS
jgi:hypothetical protein